MAVEYGSPRIARNSIVSNRQSKQFFGGLGGGGIALVATPRAEVIDNILADNSVGSGGGGGGLFLNGAGESVIAGNVIHGNEAAHAAPGDSPSQGGGIKIINDSPVLVVQNLITGNSADWGGGVLWTLPDKEPRLRLINNTIAFNPASLGSAVYANGYDGNVELINNILAGSAGAAVVHCGDVSAKSFPGLRANCLYSAGGALFTGECTDSILTEGNITVDPKFADATGADFHPSSDSPCVDAGTPGAAPALDPEGRPRPCGAGVDMGAYEVCALPAPRFVRGDATGEGGRNITDAVMVLLYLFSGGGQPGCLKAADSDDSGILNISDPIYWLSYLFLGGPPPPGSEGCAADATADELDCETPPGCR